MKKIISGSIVFFVLAMTVIIGFPTKAHAADNCASPACGFYKIVATNGNGNGQELYYDSNAHSKDLKWKKEGTIWFVDKGEFEQNEWNNSGSYHIRVADNQDYWVNAQNCENNEKAKVSYYLDPNINREIYFYRNGADDYNDLTIAICDTNGFSSNIYKLNRHKSLGNDYVNLRDDSDNNNKIWKLVPVNYSKKFAKAAPAVKSSGDDALLIKWNKLRNKYKDSDIWKNTQKIEIQYSRDKGFEKNVKKKIIKKGTVDKAKAKTKLSKIKNKKTWFLRVRLIDKNGVYSNWSKVVKIKKRVR